MFRGTRYGTVPEPVSPEVLRMRKLALDRALEDATVRAGVLP